MTSPAFAQPVAPAIASGRPRWLVISAMGVTQILAWGTSFYLPAVLARPIADDTGWSLAWIAGGVSLGLLISGLVSPRVGRMIDRTGGRPVLAASALLLACGLMLLAVAPGLPVYVAGWLVMGLGMGCGLYDAAFSTLGRLYGKDARSAITTLTLWGGFASTVCWPLSAWLVGMVGWRGTCLVYAALQLAVVLPLYALVLPRHPPVKPVDSKATGSAKPDIGRAPILFSPRGVVFTVLMLVITVGGVIMSTWGIHLLTMLQGIGVSLAAAVALGALVGPSQVGSRILEMLAARFHHHPFWTQAASSALVASGLCALAVGIPVLAPALIVYGAGSGLSSIARGTLPLALFGPAGYATLIGRLARPSLIASSLAPFVGAMLLEAFGAQSLLLALLGLASFNVACVALLYLCVRQSIHRPNIGVSAPS